MGSVNLRNGGYLLSIPLLSLPGRAGHDLNLGLTYNSKQISRTTDFQGHHWARFFYEGPTAGRWLLTAAPSLEDAGGGLWFFTTPDGAVHRLQDTGAGTPADAQDGTNIRYDPATMRVMFLDGTHFDFSEAGSLNKIRHVDRNGNRITYETGLYGRTERIVDTLGREVLIEYLSEHPWRIRAKNHAGVDLAWTFSYTQMEFKPDAYNIDYNWVGWMVTLLDTLTLPNGQTYSFEYDHEVEWQGYPWEVDYGTRCQITQMTLPTGASLAFGYGEPPYPFVDYDSLISRYVTRATVDPFGGGAFSTDYSYVVEGSFHVRTLESRADGSRREADWSESGPFSELRGKERIYGVDGTTLLREVSTSWAETGTGTAVAEVLALDVPDNAWTKTVRTLDWHGQEIRSLKYDYGNNPFSTVPVAGVRRWLDTQTSGGLYRTRLTRQDALGFEEGTGTEYVLSSTEHLYDQFPLTDRGTVVGQAPGYGAGFTDRGNPTATRAYHAGEDRFLESQVRYDTVGNPVSATDPLGRTSTVGYSAALHYAYPTQTTNPLGHTAAAGYDFETGLVVSRTDANQRTTTFNYDAYNRFWRVVFPDGGWRDRLYEDAYNLGPYRTRVRYRRGRAAVQHAWNRVEYDGLGRPLRTQIAEDGSGNWTWIEREYELCGCTGRTSRVSMPYRTGDPVYWAETQYDGLGRVLKTIPPDGSPAANHVSYEYGYKAYGTELLRAEAVFDAKGIGRVYLFDSLGRLRATGEDAGAGFTAAHWTDAEYFPETDYRVKTKQWNGQTLTLRFARHTVRETAQGAQNRHFRFDALGRAVREEHPEFFHQGVQYAKTYVYDDGGRVLSSTDPRGIVTNAVYDGLNRPLTLTYSDGTPAKAFEYDLGADGIGRLHSASNSNAVSIFAYDSMGRVTSEAKTIAGIGFTQSQVYDIEGLMTARTLPDGTTLSYTYNRTARLSGIASDLADAQHPAVLATNFAYHATGALTSVEYGNGTASSRSYTSGGLTKTLQHGTAADPGAFLDLEYGYNEGLANNGRIMRIDDRNDAARSVTYAYDGLHRLLTAETDGPEWGLAWSYDRYGNRLSQSATKGAPPTHSLAVDAATNRATGWTYDRAGNALDDTRHTYAYDADNLTTSLDGGATVYQYDAQGNRVAKISGGETTYYFFGAEYKAGTGWQRIPIMAGSLKIAEYADGTTRFFHHGLDQAHHAVAAIAAGFLYGGTLGKFGMHL